MTIPVSSVVNVSVSIGATFPARAGFVTLNIVTAETGVIGLSERIRLYNNASAVALDWPSDSEVVAAANSYFSQQPKPTKLKVSVRAGSDSNGELLGSKYENNATNLSAIQAITDGSFEISIDGDSEDITTLDFSSDTSMDDVAATIQAGLQSVGTGGYSSAVCTYQATGEYFRITSGTTGASSSITIASAVDPAVGTDISVLLGLNSGVVSAGVVAETITQSLDAIEQKDSDWYMLGFTKEVRDLVQINGEDAIVAASDWVGARVKVLMNTSNDTNSKANVSSDIGSVLKNGNYRRSITTYASNSEKYPSMSVAGRAATVDFNQPNSTITLKFKQMPGIENELISQNEKAILDSKNINALILVGDSSMYAESFMANGTFFDEVHGIDWFQNAVQSNVFGALLTSPTKVPYTDKGVAILEQACIRACDEAVRNGLAAPGETIDGRFLPNGYEVVALPVSEINQSDVDARNYPGLSITLIGAGAIHGAQVNVTFER